MRPERRTDRPGVKAGCLLEQMADECVTRAGNGEQQRWLALGVHRRHYSDVACRGSLRACTLDL